MEINKNTYHLDKLSKDKKSEISKGVSDVLLLLGTNENEEEIRILKQIGLDQHIQKAEKVKRKIQKFTAFEDRFGRKVYSGEEVEKYCLAQGFTMIRVDRFRHQVPLEVGKAIIDFNNEHVVTHERAEGKSFEKSNINLQPQNFFLLISLQSFRGTPIKCATLFYREEHSHDNYEKASTADMFVEVHSWGVPGNEKNLFWYYAKECDYVILFPFVFMALGLVCLLFSENNHSLILFLMIISAVCILTIKKSSFFIWNQS